MKIKKLELIGMRAFNHAIFEFQPGMNLLVGVNGVGKTTVLDALRISLFKILQSISASNSPKQLFELSDISIGAKSMQISCDFAFNSISSNLIVKKNQVPIVIKEQKSDNPKDISKREVYKEMQDIEIMSDTFNDLVHESKKSKIQPIAIYFSTKRSIIIDQKVSKSLVVVGQAAAYAESLKPNRDFNLRIFAQWFKVQEELGKERPLALKHIAVLRNAVEIFLPGFKNLRVEQVEDKSHFMVDKKGTSLSLYQLSDGERGVLSMVLDIARRLSQSNPELENPLEKGSAIVLIDELDLHLHPKWQRTIVENLTRTFPNCQFIVTTHSPQIIPSVEPERILLIKDGEITHPDKTLGMDSNWILRFLMEADDRPQESIDAITKVENLIDEADFDEARQLIRKFKSEGLDLSEWIMFEARIARLEILGDKE